MNSAAFRRARSLICTPDPSSAHTSSSQSFSSARKPKKQSRRRETGANFSTTTPPWFQVIRSVRVDVPSGADPGARGRAPSLPLRRRRHQMRSERREPAAAAGCRRAGAGAGGEQQLVGADASDTNAGVAVFPVPSGRRLRLSSPTLRVSGSRSAAPPLRLFLSPASLPPSDCFHAIIRD